MTKRGRYTVTYTAAARRQMNKLPLAAAAAMHEHLIGPVADNPYRLGKQLDPPLEQLHSTRRGEYRALYTINDGLDLTGFHVRRPDAGECRRDGESATGRQSRAPARPAP